MPCTISITPVLQLPQLMDIQSQILIFWAILMSYILAIYQLKKGVGRLLCAWSLRDSYKPIVRTFPKQLQSKGRSHEI
jgi:hypothetical protein